MHEQSFTTVLAGTTSPLEVVARIGLILLSTDEVGGDAFSSMMPKDKVLVFPARTAYDYAGDVFSLARSFEDVVATLPPAGRLDVLAFSCTACAVSMGVEKLLSQLKEARPGIKYTSPAGAGVAALRQLKAKRIALLSPYQLGVHRSLLPFFRDNGFEVIGNGTFATSGGAESSELRRESIFSAIEALTGPALPDALFVSCTGMPVVPHIDRLEKEIGIPVVTSAQAMAWDALRLAGYHDPIHGFGQLLGSER